MVQEVAEVVCLAQGVVSVVVSLLRRLDLVALAHLDLCSLVVHCLEDKHLCMRLSEK